LTPGSRSAISGGVGSRDPERLSDAVWTSRLHGPVPALSVVGLALGLTWLGRLVSWPLAAALGVVLMAVLAAMVVLVDRPRWKAQDVIDARQRYRRRRWIRDTGSDPPDDRAAAEVWLGAHLPGSVPPVYRALAAITAEDDRQQTTTLAALPSQSPADVFDRAWIRSVAAFTGGGPVDSTELREALALMPDSDDRLMGEIWVALLDAYSRWRRRESQWWEPIGRDWPAARSSVPAARVGAGLWFRRLALPFAFAATAVTAGVIVTWSQPTDGAGANYGQTELSTRGEVQPDADPHLWRAMVGVEAALPSARRIVASPLDEEAVDALLASRLPTVIWRVDRLDLSPGDSPHRHIWSLEILGGGPSPSMVVTLDRMSGPAYLYDLDARAWSDVRGALGLPAGASP
jgi:hypothetical protein